MTTSFTEENYLKTIYHLSKDMEIAVNTNAIADSLNTKAASVTDMLRKLAEKGLINYKKYQGVTLTENGKNNALNIIRKHRLWEVFLVEKLKFNWDEVHDVAEELEHIHSDLLINRLDEFLEFPKIDPHGDPIPDKNGKFHVPDLKPVCKLKIGECGIISGIRDHSSVFLKYLDEAKLTLGQKIEVLNIIEFDGSFVLNIQNQRQTISRDVAKNLLIAYE
ncbi:iron (metal) dependent repressor, DtxR family [Pseudopedobacter saltans DSM 12145]|uniref:Transcriptional regulator MntR n=1 Tax=Pseudopedobacter saltans (strain ATCC 51119 / DSM 12145 / JCM 21818 / CCUG 39354 / LMG 10337 / NBRC 100064 / NCIMB 13643) TaxID=762903 RepID=F0S9X8_PSESL|nr:metal-dependent transcriptional regulator [Pseudopedobacter saltans]ADY52536.1 iron (metal) dependent repressor, DtxR family [Pseudopedobacter saltans DSM 12145]